MGDTRKFRQDKAMRLANWAAENQREWSRICNCNEDFMDAEECISYIELMESNQFYSMIPVILTNNYNQAQIYQAIMKRMVQAFTKNWSVQDLQAICQELKEAIKEASRKKTAQ